MTLPLDQWIDRSIKDTPSSETSKNVFPDSGPCLCLCDFNSAKPARQNQKGLD